MKPSYKVSIVILDFLKSERTVENVASILAQDLRFPIEIIIVDNSCATEHAERLKKLDKFNNVRVIINPKNVGYTRGINIGARQAKGEYLLILNPDIVWRDKSALRLLVEYLDAHPEVGLVAPKQINETDGRMALTARAFPKFWVQVARRTWLRTLPLLRGAVARDEMQGLSEHQPTEVDWIQSSCVLLRRKLYEEIGGLSERYFLFMSDPHLCFEIWRRGSSVVFYPEAVVHADGIRASGGGVLDFFRKWTLRQHVWEALKYQWYFMGKGNPRRRALAARTTRKARG